MTAHCAGWSSVFLTSAGLMPRMQQLCVHSAMTGVFLHMAYSENVVRGCVLPDPYAPFGQENLAWQFDWPCCTWQREWAAWCRHSSRILPHRVETIIMACKCSFPDITAPNLSCTCHCDSTCAQRHICLRTRVEIRELCLHACKS